MAFQDTDYRKLINNNWYKFMITLSNPDGYNHVFTINSIKSLIINDQLDNWWNTGSFTYIEEFGSITRRLVSNESINNGGLPSSIKDSLKSGKGYMFRNDGRDYLDIDIKPLNDNTNEKNDITFPDEFYRLTHRYVVYDRKVEDVTPTSQRITLFFWDENYQIALERHIQWSTAISKLNENIKDKDVTTLTDDKLMMPSGLALKSFLTELGFKIKESQFDTGGNLVFATSYSDTNADDTIEYILRKHLASDGDICFLNTDRLTNEFSLKKLSDMFKLAGSESTKPGDLQLEHLFVLDSPASQENVVIYKSPISKEVSTTKDVKGVIKSFRFVENSGQCSTSNFINTAVISYNHKTKTFIYNASDSTIKNVMGKMMETHIRENVLIDGGNCIQIKGNSTKNNYQTYKVAHTPIATKGTIKKAGYGNLLEKVLQLSNCMEMSLEGSMLRKAGTFIALDSNSSINNNDYDNKVFGQWLVMKVAHNFSEESYSNEVLAVKPYQYKENDLRNDV